MVGQDSNCREGGWMRADERALSRWMKRFESLAEPSDMRVLKEARDGDLNVLTNYYMRLPGGGTRWRGGGGGTGHYPALFEYGPLHEGWGEGGRSCWPSRGPGRARRVR